MKNWVSYQNGNYKVTLNTKTGTKIRSNDLDFFEASTVESMDVKVTNKCDMGCPMCHENSLANGKHSHVMENSKCIVDFLNNLHPYCELAIGGGNPLCWSELDEFLQFCKEKEFLPSMTVNQVHFEKEYDRIKALVDNNLIYGLGISLENPTKEFIEKVKTIPNAVIHVINGLVSKNYLEKLKNNNLKILVLGYKEVRRGEKLYSLEGNKIEEEKNIFKSFLPIILQENWFKVVSFDNLAIKQLDVKSLLSEEEWNEFFMGDDGQDGQQTSATFFVDLVEGKFAKNSCCMERQDILSTVEEMYNILKRQ